MCIRDRLKKDHKFVWTAELNDCFVRVKNLFVDAVVLRFPCPDQRYYIQCDASDYAYGGQLYQLDEEGEIGVIAFTSKTFNGAAVSYTHLDVYKRQRR